MTRVGSLLQHSREDAAVYLRRAGGAMRPVAESVYAQRVHLADLRPVSIEGFRQARDHPRVTALIGAGTAAVAAAGTVYAMRHSGRPFAEVLSDEQPYRVSTLADLRYDEPSLELIQRELLAEWGPFGPQDMDEMHRLVRNAGRLVFVIRFYEDNGDLGPPSGVLQTGLCDAGGDPDHLRAAYESFDAITAGSTWAASPAMQGDTAMLLQITAFGARSRGVGGRLRDTALYMLPASVKYALTTTPVPPDYDIEAGPESQPATKFHYRGGARPAGYAPGFKLPAEERSHAPAGRQSNTDVVFMRYSRGEDGAWEGVKRPDLQLRRHSMELPRPRWRTRRAAPETLAA